MKTSLPTFTAQYHGHCSAECGVPIMPGEECTWLVEPDASGAGGDIAHLDCVAAPVPVEEPPARAVPASRVCQHCFLVLPSAGHCDCQD